MRSFVVVVVLQLSLNNGTKRKSGREIVKGVYGVGLKKRKTNIKQAWLNLFNKPKRAEAKRITAWKKTEKIKMKKKRKNKNDDH